MIGQDLQLPFDGAGFSARQCPRCGADFKVRCSRRDARVLASVLAHRLEHLNASEAACAASPRHCPYCGATAPPDAFWTADQRTWLEGQARDLADELRWRRMRTPRAGLSDDPRPANVAIPATSEPLRARDDEDDALVAVAVSLPCCGEELLLDQSWTGPLRCHYCGFVHARSVVRDIGLELAQLRDWVVEP